MRDIQDIMRDITEDVNGIIEFFSKKAEKVTDLSNGKKLWGNKVTLIKGCNEYKKFEKNVDALIQHPDFDKIRSPQLFIYFVNHVKRFVGDKEIPTGSYELQQPIPVDVQGKDPVYEKIKKMLLGINKLAPRIIGYGDDYFASKFNKIKVKAIYMEGAIPKKGWLSREKNWVGSESNYSFDAIYCIYFVCAYEQLRLNELQDLDDKSKYQTPDTTMILNNKSELQYYSVLKEEGDEMKELNNSSIVAYNNENNGDEDYLDIPYTEHRVKRSYLINTAKVVIIATSSVFVLGTMLACGWYVTPLIGGLYSASLVLFSSYLGVKVAWDGINWLDSPSENNNESNKISVEELKEKPAFKIAPSLSTTKKMLMYAKIAASSAVILAAACLIVGTIAASALYITSMIGVLFSTALIVFMSYLAIKSTIDIFPMIINFNTKPIENYCLQKQVTAREGNIEKTLELIAKRKLGDQVFKSDISDSRSRYLEVVQYLDKQLTETPEFASKFIEQWTSSAMWKKDLLLFPRSDSASSFINRLIECDQDSRVELTKKYLQEVSTHGTRTKTELIESIVNRISAEVSFDEKDSYMFGNINL